MNQDTFDKILLANDKILKDYFLMFLLLLK